VFGKRAWVEAEAVVVAQQAVAEALHQRQFPQVPPQAPLPVVLLHLAVRPRVEAVDEADVEERVVDLRSRRRTQRKPQPKRLSKQPGRRTTKPPTVCLPASPALWGSPIRWNSC